MSAPYNCQISECRAPLLGASYFVLTLDDGRTIAVCPNCYARVRKPVTSFFGMPNLLVADPITEERS